MLKSFFSWLAGTPECLEGNWGRYCMAGWDQRRFQESLFTVICQSTWLCAGWAAVNPGMPWAGSTLEHHRTTGLFSSQRCSLDHYSHFITATAVNTAVSKTEIFSSSYYSAIPFSSVFFTSKSILTQSILFIVSLTDGFKDSQCCIVNNFSVAWLFPSVHISKPINSLLFSNGY